MRMKLAEPCRLAQYLFRWSHAAPSGARSAGQHCEPGGRDPYPWARAESPGIEPTPESIGAQGRFFLSRRPAQGEKKRPWQGGREWRGLPVPGFSLRSRPQLWGLPLSGLALTASSRVPGLVRPSSLDEPAPAGTRSTRTKDAKDSRDIKDRRRAPIPSLASLLSLLSLLGFSSTHSSGR